MKNTNIVMILTVLTIALIALTGVASAFYIPPPNSAAVVKINTVVANGMYTVNGDGSTTFHPDGTYTIHGTIDNTKGSNESRIVITFISLNSTGQPMDLLITPLPGTYDVSPGSTFSFTTRPIKATTGQLATEPIVFNLGFNNTIMVQAVDHNTNNGVKVLSEAPDFLYVTVDLNNVKYVNATGPNTNIDQGSMDDAIAVYNNTTGTYSTFSQSWVTQMFNSISQIFSMF